MRTKGDLVTGHYSGMPIRSTCRNHIFEVVNEAQAVEYGCGFIQAAKCLVCGDLIPNIDADAWHEITLHDVSRCLMEMEEMTERYGRVKLLLTGKSVGLRNFE